MLIIFCSWQYKTVTCREFMARSCSDPLFKLWLSDSFLTTCKTKSSQTETTKLYDWEKKLNNVESTHVACGQQFHSVTHTPHYVNLPRSGDHQMQPSLILGHDPIKKRLWHSFLCWLMRMTDLLFGAKKCNQPQKVTDFIFRYHPRKKGHQNIFELFMALRCAS